MNTKRGITEIRKACHLWMNRFLLRCDGKGVTLVGRPRPVQRVRLNGAGRIAFGRGVQLGIWDSPGCLTGEIYVEARGHGAEVVFGDDIYVNNNSSFICLGSRIEIGSQALIGFNVTIVDSDFHVTSPVGRMTEPPGCRPVVVEENVLIGAHACILKGVTIGRNSVVGMGAVVTKTVPANTIVAGNPARVIGVVNGGK